MYVCGSVRGYESVNLTIYVTVNVLHKCRLLLLKLVPGLGLDHEAEVLALVFSVLLALLCNNIDVLCFNQSGSCQN